MNDKVTDLILRTLQLDDTLARSREFVEGGVLSEEKYQAIADAIHDFQDAVADRLNGAISHEELRARADLVLDLMRP